MKTGRVTKIVLASAFLLIAVLSTATAQSLRENSGFRAELTDLTPNTSIKKYGNLITTGTAEDFTAAGFDWGDLVYVSFLGKTLELPVVTNYSDVETGMPAVVMDPDKDGNPTGHILFAINMGDFTTTYGIASKKTNEDNSWYWVANEGIELPVEFLFTMSGKVRFRPLSPDSSQSRDSWMKYALMLFSVIRTDS